jgi:hypothetical protein
VSKAVEMAALVAALERIAAQDDDRWDWSSGIAIRQAPPQEIARSALTAAPERARALAKQLADWNETPEWGITCREAAATVRAALGMEVGDAND